MLITQRSSSLVHVRTKPVSAGLGVIHNWISFSLFLFFTQWINYEHVIIGGLKCHRELNWILYTSLNVIFCTMVFPSFPFIFSFSPCGSQNLISWSERKTILHLWIVLSPARLSWFSVLFLQTARIALLQLPAHLSIWMSRKMSVFSGVKAVNGWHRAYAEFRCISTLKFSPVSVSLEQKCLV